MNLCWAEPHRDKILQVRGRPFWCCLCSFCSCFFYKMQFLLLSSRLWLLSLAMRGCLLALCWNLHVTVSQRFKNRKKFAKGQEAGEQHTQTALYTILFDTSGLRAPSNARDKTHFCTRNLISWIPRTAPLINIYSHGALPLCRTAFISNHCSQ